MKKVKRRGTEVRKKGDKAGFRSEVEVGKLVF